jgi:hypothetical protein
MGIIAPIKTLREKNVDVKCLYYGKSRLWALNQQRAG